MNDPPSRRNVLETSAVCFTGFIAGCSLISDRPELLLFNQLEELAKISISITRLRDESVVFSESIELEADTEKQWQLDLESNTHQIITQIQGGMENSIQWVPGDKWCCMEIHLQEDSIEYRGRSSG